MFRNINIYVDLLKYKHVEINKLSDINPVTLQSDVKILASHCSHMLKY